MGLPRGFITPRVGPHQSYGFSPGTVFGKKADFKIIPQGFSISNPSLEHIVAKEENGTSVYILLLNQHHEEQIGTVQLDLNKYHPNLQPTSVRMLDQNGKVIRQLPAGSEWDLSDIDIELTAPINLNEDKKDSVAVRMTNSHGEDMAVYVTEAGPFSTLLEGRVKIGKNSLQAAGQTLLAEKGETIRISYGYGFFKKEASFRFLE